MKIVNPKVEEIKDFEGVNNFYHAVARAARICYASDKTTDDKALVERLIENKHFSPFEHAIISIKDDYSDQEDFITNAYMYTYSNHYTILPNGKRYIITNGRVIVESVIKAKVNNNCSNSTIELLDLILDFFKKNEIITNEFKSFIVDTSIGTTREINRHHNNFYICEQSTRYCNFSKDKFGGEISVNEPYWFDNEEYYNKMFPYWYYSIQVAEKQYLDALKAGVPTDTARGVLPLDTHTRAIYTATIEEWQHIIDLRLKGTTGKPHGDIKVIAEKINNLLHDNNTSVK